MASSSGAFVSGVEDTTCVFRYADPGHAADRVRLWTDLHLADSALARVDGGWELRVADAGVDRVEYLFEVDDEHVTDPGNDLGVDGAFGRHSVLELPGYRAPGWLSIDQVPATRESTVLATGDGDVAVELWTPAAETGCELPLLLVHDGPEMDAYGRITQYAGAMIAAGRLPAFRVALLSPGPDRNERYAANPAYARALTGEVVPRLRATYPTLGRPVLAGESLGAVAALYAAWTSPGTFGGLLLQSGSFFTPATDPQEEGYVRWGRLTGFVATVHAATRAAPNAPRVALTCGTAEENLANNRLMADQLRAVGMQVSWGEIRDGHTWTCWRDLLDPHLTALCRAVWP